MTGLSRGGIRRCAPFVVVTDWATPMTRPTAAPVDCRSNAGAGVVKLTCHRPARSRVTLADVAAVISAHCREMRNRTHPALGTCTSPHFRLSRRTERSRMQKPSWTPALRQVGWAKWWGLFHQFWKARSRSRRAARITTVSQQKELAEARRE